MCLTAMYLSGVSSVYYAYSNEDGARYGLSAERGYVEIARATKVKTSTKPGRRSRRLLRDGGQAVLRVYHCVAAKDVDTIAPA
jgi:tRNA(Arg) A34 adenosine deaminase TadA